MYWNEILAYHKVVFYEPAQRAGVAGGVLWVKADNKAGYKSEHFSFNHTLTEAYSLTEIRANTSKATQSGSLILQPINVVLLIKLGTACFFNSISQTQSDSLQEIFFFFLKQLWKLEAPPPHGFLWQLHDWLAFASLLFYIHLFHISFNRFKKTNTQHKGAWVFFQIKTVLN